MWRVWIHYTFLAPQYKRFLTSFDELLESNFLELGGNKMSVPKRSISHCCRYFTYLVCTHVAAQKFIWFRYLFSYLSTNYYTTKQPTYLISICLSWVVCILRKIIHRRLPEEDPDARYHFKSAFINFFMSINYDSTTNFHLEMSQFLQFTNPIINGIFLLSL